MSKIKNNRDPWIFCKYCYELQPVEVRARAEVYSDCETCGEDKDLSVTLRCSVCGHGLWAGHLSWFGEDDTVVNSNNPFWTEETDELVKDLETKIEELITKLNLVGSSDNLLVQVKVQQKILKGYIEKYGQDKEIYGNEGRLDKPTKRQLIARKRKKK